MKIHKKALAALASATVLAVSMPAQADHDTTGFQTSLDGLTIVIECDTLGGILKALTPEYVAFGSDGKAGYEPDNGKDREGLNGKLDEVHNKYLHADPPKLCDAAQKFDDFGAKVQQLHDGNTDYKKKIWNVTAKDAITCLIDGSAAYAEELRILNGGCDAADAGKPPRGKGPK